MGWERRKDTTRRYYTRSVRMGSRVRRQYVGPGVLGQLVAEQDAEARAQRERAHQARLVARERVLAEDATYAAFCRRVELLTRAVLLAADYRRHTRGQWRKRRCA